MQPSEEQRAIMESLLESKQNVTVSAVAGSGKSTTIIFCVKAKPLKKFLVLTYNKKLEQDIKKKTKKLKNAKTYTYHGYVSKISRKSVYDDFQMLKALNKILVESKNGKYFMKGNFDVVILDETQDQSLLYYQAVLQIILMNTRPLQFLVLGDEKQCINQYKGADHRFLEQVEWLYKTSFVHKTLNTSYRLSFQNAQFLNECIFQEERIRAVQSGSPPELILYNKRQSHGTINHQMIQMFEYLSGLIKEYGEENSFVIIPCSPYKNSESRSFINHLTMKGVKLHVIDNAERSEKNKDVEKHKVCVQTFHSTKGLERDLVIMFNFDSSFFSIFRDDYQNPDKLRVLPNILYVAMTRPKKKLVLLHDTTQKPFPFVNYAKLPNFLQIRDFQKNQKSFEGILQKAENKDELVKSIIDSIFPLCKHCNANHPKPIFKLFHPSSIAEKLDVLDVNRILKFFHVRVLQKPKDLAVPIQNFVTTTIEEKNITENVSDINGTLIPIFYQYKTQNILVIKNNIEKYLTINSIIGDHRDYLEQIQIEGAEERFAQVEDILALQEFKLELMDQLKKKKINNFSELNKICQEIEYYFYIRQYLSFMDGNMEREYSREEIIQMCILWDQYKKQVFYKVLQIGNFDWIAEETMVQCMKNIENLKISKHAKFEERKKKMLRERSACRNSLTLSGFADCVDGKTLYEFKCVGQVNDYHIVQLCMYMLLFRESVETGILYNILNQHKIEVVFNQNYSSENLQCELIDILEKKNEEVDQRDFLERTDLVFKKYFC